MKRPPGFRRPTRELYYCRIAREVGARGTCLRRNFGTVITNAQKTEITSTGYTGAPRGMRDCTERGTCLRETLKIAPGHNYELCRSVHAEMNAMIHASRQEMFGGHLFLAGVDAKTRRIVADAEPCKLCKRMIINAGIGTVWVLVDEESVKCINVEEDWGKREEEVFETELPEGY
jgi:dCMP deaminase